MCGLFSGTQLHGVTSNKLKTIRHQLSLFIQCLMEPLGMSHLPLLPLLPYPQLRALHSRHWHVVTPTKRNQNGCLCRPPSEGTANTRENFNSTTSRTRQLCADCQLHQIFRCRPATEEQCSCSPHTATRQEFWLILDDSDYEQLFLTRHIF
jgi:hypothetical protein